MNAQSFLDQLHIASPCDVPWDAMQGDHRSRHCAQCDKRVYNLANLTRDEAMALFSNPDDLPCVQLWKRADGTVLTADCPVGLRRLRARRTRALSAALFATLMLSATASLRAEDGKAKPKPPQSRRLGGKPTRKDPPPPVGGKVLPPLPVQGLIACPPPPKADKP